jgi:hypothetical protein
MAPLAGRALAGTLTALATLVALASAAAPAHADGELTATGMYYKEKATRVVQPMLDARFEVGERASADAHFLVDAITSASLSAGPTSATFTENRLEAAGGYRRQLGDLRLGASARYSTEPDYKARYGALTGDLELFDKNVTLSATLGAGYDSIVPAGAQERHSLTIVNGSLAASQIVGVHGVVGLSYDVIRLDGYQANPYRRVQIAGTANLRPESHPDLRTRHAIAATVKWFLPSIEATVIGQYRFYADDWDLHAHTPELRLTKDLGEWMVVGARYRYHRQDAADFYQDSYTMDQPYLSDDPKLSAFDSHLFGARFELTAGALGLTGRLEQARVELVGEYVVQHNHFGNAVVSYASLVLPFEY